MTPEIQEKLDAAKAPFVASVEAMDAIPALVDAAEQASYDKGFASGEISGIEKGKAMIQLPDASDPAAQYTQEQVNNAVNSAVATKEAEMQIVINEKVAMIEERDAKIAELQALVDGKQVEVDAAVAARTKEIMADWKSAQVDDEAFAAKYGA